MNILHINSYSITSALYKNLYKQLDAKEIKQKIYIPVKNNADKGNNFVDLKNSTFFYINTFNSIDRILYFTKINKSYKGLVNNIEFKDVNLIHAHSLFINGGIAYKMKKKKNIDYIVAVRSTDVEIFFKYAIHLRRKGIEILKGAKKIIFISPAYKERLIEQYIPKKLKREINDKSVIIPNGINSFWLKNQGQVRELGQKINLIYAGRFIKRKKILTSIEVVKRLKKKGLNVSLKIIGKGKQESKIKKIAKENKDLIDVYGYMSAAELIKMYRESNIFIMPSYKETFGLVYIEAMSQGLPIIYAANEGVDGYFKDGAVGYSVDHNNIDDIVEKVRLIIDDYDNISQRALNLAKQFSWDKVSDRYIDLYSELYSS